VFVTYAPFQLVALVADPMFVILMSKRVLVQRLASSGDRLLLRRIVVQAWPQPSFDFVYAHSFAFSVIGNLITVDLA